MFRNTATITHECRTWQETPVVLECIGDTRNESGFCVSQERLCVPNTKWSAKSSHALLDHVCTYCTRRIRLCKRCHACGAACSLVHPKFYAGNQELAHITALYFPLAFLLSASPMKQYSERGRHRDRPCIPADEVGRRLAAREHRPGANRAPSVWLVVPHDVADRDPCECKDR